MVHGLVCSGGEGVIHIISVRKYRFGGLYMRVCVRGSSGGNGVENNESNLINPRCLYYMEISSMMGFCYISTIITFVLVHSL